MRFGFRSLVAVASMLVVGAFGTVQASAQVKSLFVGFDGSVSDVFDDILGNSGDVRFNIPGSSFLESPGSVTLSQLQPYNSVLLWSNYSPNSLDVLADYMDGGGRLVLATFMGAIEAAGIASGRIYDAGYNPFSGATEDAYSPRTLGTYDASSPLMAGVTSLASSQYNADYTGVRASSTLVASWDNGRPLAAINGNQRVIGITLFPNVVGYSHATGDYARLFRNALAFEGTSSVPEPGSLALVSMGTVGMAGFWIRARRRR